jgi:hypothetical protein
MDKNIKEQEKVRVNICDRYINASATMLLNIVAVFSNF